MSGSTVMMVSVFSIISQIVVVVQSIGLGALLLVAGKKLGRLENKTVLVTLCYIVGIICIVSSILKIYVTITLYQSVDLVIQ